MTLPEKLRAADDELELALRCTQSMGACDAVIRAQRLLLDIARALDPEDDDEDDQLSILDNCRREVVPGWTLDEILSREG